MTSPIASIVASATVPMLTLEWMLGWWNLIFVVPFAIALTYLGLYISTGITFGDADVEAHIDADAAAEADTDHGAHAHTGHVAHSGTSLAVLHLIGVGKMPLSLLVMILLFSWGISGFAAVQYLRPFVAEEDRIALYAIPFAAWTSLCITAIGARVLGRIFPMTEAPATALNDLVGQRGVAVLNINDDFGLAQIENPRGAAIQVPCRVGFGEEPIPNHSPIVVLRFDRVARVFYVSTPVRYEELRATSRVVPARV